MNRAERAMQYRRRADLLLASAASTPDKEHRMALLAAAKHFADLADAIDHETNSTPPDD